MSKVFVWMCLDTQFWCQSAYKKNFLLVYGALFSPVKSRLKAFLVLFQLFSFLNEKFEVEKDENSL